MDDLVLSARIDESTTLYISPIDEDTYAEHVESDNLGGGSGYFVLRATRVGTREKMDILAKAESLEAASVLFDMIVSNVGRQFPVLR
jgi:hypothetical protein